LEKHDARSLPADHVDEDDPLCILFTSGTTGRPKGAMLSHRAHIHMMMQAALQGQVGAMLEPASSPIPALGCTVAVSPMFHISGFSVAVIGGALIGLTSVYLPPGRWDPEIHMQMTEDHQATAWSLVPTQLWRILDHPRFGDYDLSSLRRVGGGGSTFQPELWRQVRERMPQVALMGTGYGMTETCGAGTHHDRSAAVRHPDAVGAPVPGYMISIRDPEGGDLAEGERGVIHLRGASNLLGYWSDPAATAAALDSDRWYRTGEWGHVEDGLLFLDGRGPDVIIRGGENIYPIEIENRLIEHPAVAEAAVVGVPERVMGEEVKAFVVLQPGAEMALDDLRSWVSQSLAAFKVPTQMEVRDALPHNAAGKVVKPLLTGTAAPGFEEE
jgi:acyl-CoA synthetase (AMP-forming)/AMP-acid ligase II